MDEDYDMDPEDFEDFDDFEDAAEMLQDAHQAALQALKAADLRSSGTWGLTVYLAQTTTAFTLLKEGLKNIMCVIYDLSRSNDPTVKVDAIRSFVELQLLSLDTVVESLITDIEDPDSEFHTPRRKEVTAVIHELHNAMAEGIDTREAYVDTVERRISDPDQRAMLIEHAAGDVKVFNKNAKDRIGPLLDMLRGDDTE